MPMKAKDKLLQAAAKLFYNRGIVATGVDAVIAEAGVAKMSLYNNFKSKSQLVTAYINARHEQWLDLYYVRLTKAVTPQQRILAVFFAYKDHAECAYDNGFRGCGLLNAAAEMQVGSAEREAVKQHKHEVRQLLLSHVTNLASNAQPHTIDAQVLTSHLMFLLEGSICLAGLESSSEQVDQAISLVKKLVSA